jgi:uncharacterized protein (TIGR03382 family)
MMKVLGRVVIAVAVLLGAAVRPAHADSFLFGGSEQFLGDTLQQLAITIGGSTFLFNTFDSQIDAGVDNQGWWSDTIGNADDNDNYIVGTIDPGFRFNNFFTFDLTSLGAGAITAAELRLTRHGTALDSGPVTYRLYDVTTPTLTLNDNVGPSAAIYSDLGTGTLYGSIGVASLVIPDPLVISLNAAAIAAIDAVRTSTAPIRWFNIGGTLNEPQSIPAPAALTLLLLGGGAALRRRQRARRS